MAGRASRFDGFEARSGWAAFAAAFAGWFGGTAMLSIVQALLGPSGDTKQPYLLGALFGLTFPLGWFILFGLWLTALLSHGALRIAGRTSKLAYGGAGAVVGLLAGSLVVGYLFKEPIRAAFCGIPVGIACGLLFRRIALPAQSVPRSPRAPGSAMLHL